jgi:cell division septation protein DedD
MIGIWRKQNGGFTVKVSKKFLALSVTPITNLARRIQAVVLASRKIKTKSKANGRPKVRARARASLGSTGHPRAGTARPKAPRATHRVTAKCTGQTASGYQTPTINTTDRQCSTPTGINFQIQILLAKFPVQRVN